MESRNFFHLIFPSGEYIYFFTAPPPPPINFLMVRSLVELEVFQDTLNQTPCCSKVDIAIHCVVYPVDNAIRVSLILMYLIPIYLVDNAIQCLNNRRQVLKVFQTIQKNLICTSNNVMHFRSR